MNKQLETRLQSRITMLYRYSRAMERGDSDTIAAILDEAQQDSILERMVLEMNEVYQIVDCTVVHPDDVMTAQEMLQATFAGSKSGDNGPVEDLYVMQTYTDEATENTPDLEPILAPVASKSDVPAPRFVQRRWYRSRTRWFLGAAAAMLIFLLIFPGTGALANQFLSLFRVQQFQPVQTVERPEELTRNMALALQNFGTVQWDRDMDTSVVTHASGTNLSDIEKSLSFHPQLPTVLPDGVGRVPQFSVSRSTTTKFVFNQATAQAYLKQTGQSDVVIPASLANAQFSIKLAPGFAAVYYDHCDAPAQDGKQSCSSGKANFVIGEIPGPQITADGKASLSDLRAFLLSLPRLTPDLHNLVAHTDVNSGVIPVPVPSDANGQQVSVQGVQGVSLSYAKGNLIVWQKQGLIYIVTAYGSDSAQVLKSVQSFR
jgi:hypothetical protein